MQDSEEHTGHELNKEEHPLDNWPFDLQEHHSIKSEDDGSLRQASSDIIENFRL